MNKVMALSAFAAGLFVSAAALAAPAPGAFADAMPDAGLILARAGGGMSGGGMGSAGGARFSAAPSGNAGPHISGGPGPHFNGNPHLGNPHLGANNNDLGRDHDHGRFDHDHFRHGRFFPGDVFVYGGDYGYYGDCGWLRRQATLTGSPYWWRRYQACIY